VVLGVRRAIYFDAPEGSAQLTFGAAEIDPGNANPEVVVAFYTGGAHCCSDTSVVTSSPDGSTWTTVDVGEFDGGPLLASDIDGDGRYEFETRDNAFPLHVRLLCLLGGAARSDRRRERRRQQRDERGAL